MGNGEIPVDRDEFTAVEEAILKERESGAAEEETKRIRVRHGIYSMRGKHGRYVIRIRVPAGILTPDQLDLVAEVVEKHSGTDVAHLTTRQGIEIADVSGKEIGPILRRMKELKLTTSRTGGNVVRNVVCCPFSGVSREEVFDVAPYVLFVDQFLRDAADYQSLPRKVKIAFESCTQDHVRTRVSDIGLRAVKRNGQCGFLISVGGGLGAVPMVGQMLEEFTPLEALLPTLEAILRVFNRHGNRTNRNRARLKWLIKDWGIERFRDAVFSERLQLISEQRHQAIKPIVIDEDPPPMNPVRHGASRREMSNGVKFSPTKKNVHTDLFEEWKIFNVQPHRQLGLYAVTVRCPMGDLKKSQLRSLSVAARRFSGGTIRTTIEQNVVLRWVWEEALRELYEFLEPEGLSTCCADQIMDITRCVGRATCLSAITNPGGACRAIALVLGNGFRHVPEIRAIRIRISGCLNSCGHHHASDIGLFGMAKRFYDRLVPHYAILLGGENTGLEFGKRVIEVPACQIAHAVEKVLQFYVHMRDGTEPFHDFVQRVGVPEVRVQLKDLTQVPPPEEGPDFYRDLDASRDFTMETREGECAV